MPHKAHVDAALSYTDHCCHDLWRSAVGLRFLCKQGYASAMLLACKLPIVAVVIAMNPRALTCLTSVSIDHASCSCVCTAILCQRKLGLSLFESQHMPTDACVRAAFVTCKCATLSMCAERPLVHVVCDIGHVRRKAFATCSA